MGGLYGVGSRAAMAARLRTLLLLGLVLLAAADQEPEDEGGANTVSEESESDDMGVKGTSEFAKTTILFPDFQDKKFVQGQFVDALCGFSNLGDKSFNITNLKGYLISPYDYSMYIQNFSEVPAYTEVKKGEEGTLMYRFLPDPALEPREYLLTLTVDYIDADKEEYQSAFFNSTIEIVESQSALDSRILFGRFLSVCFLGVLGLVGNAAYSRLVPKRRKTVDTSARSKESSQNEWLQGTFVGGQKSSSGNKKKSK